MKLRHDPILNQIIWWALAIGLVVGCAASDISGFDWFTYYYRRANESVYRSLYNPLWIYLIITPIAWLPPKVSFFLFTLLNVAMMWLGSRLTGANKFLLLLSFPAFWVLWYGQIDGFVMLGAALGYWAVQQQRPALVGGAMALLAVKPHIGGPLALLYLFWSRHGKALAVLAGIAAVSMLVWGWRWPFTWLYNLAAESARGQTAAQNTNISVFPYGMLAWTALLVPMSRLKRSITVLAVTFLSLPYAPIYSLIVLLVMPLPWWAYVLSSAPYLLGQNGYWIATFTPLGVLVWVLYPEIGPWLKERFSRLT